MDIVEVGSALSNTTRVRLLSIISEHGPLSSKQAHERYVEKFDSKRRESVYKALEKLVDAGILTKFYDREGEGIVYDIEADKLIINFQEMQIVLE
jgi:DNA-binding transcriptional ArsR family regulator